MYSYQKFLKIDNEYRELSRIENMSATDYMKINTDFITCNKEVEDYTIIGIKRNDNILEILIKEDI